MASEGLQWEQFPFAPADEVERVLMPTILESLSKIKARRARREHYLQTIGEGPKPYLYVIVTTGNIYEDVIQAQACARQGADIIAVIRTTGQSLLDYVPRLDVEKNILFAEVRRQSADLMAADDQPRRM